MQTSVTSPVAQKPPSILKSLALAVGTLTLSTWALGTLWMQTEAPREPREPSEVPVETARINADVVASNAP